MLTAVRRWFDDPKKRLMRVLGDAPLPHLPAAALEALQTLRNPENPLSMAAEQISRDPALSIAILRFANSASSGLRKKVDDVRHAAMLMGRANLEATIVSVAVRKALPSARAPGFDPDRFWKTAARRSAIAREVAGVIDPRMASVAATAGLLQDLAIPLLAQRNRDAYAPVLQKWQQEGGDLAKHEREVFEWDHARVGQWVAEEWALPASLTGVIGDHHILDEAMPAVGLVSIISERGDPRETERLIEEAHNRFGASRDRLASAIDRAEQG